METRRNGEHGGIFKGGFALFVFLLLLVLGLTTLSAQDNKPPSPLSPPSYPADSKFLTPSAVEQPLTQRYITQYSSAGGITWLSAVMERADYYLPFINEEIAKRNLPPELAYLPVIESGYLSTARSKSGAVGLWQFMMNSISPFGIKVNNFVDERRDFVKATRGALQKLEDNYKTLGNWELALAAYNSGLGAVSRTVKKTGSRNYWDLCKKNELRSETIHYVPKFIAVAWILSNPESFCLTEPPQTFEWDAIPLDRQVSLDILAREAEVDKELLRALNAELLHGITPPDKNYRLKVPKDSLVQINFVLAQEDIKLLEYYRHVIKYGDTVYGMSKYYGVSANFIEQYNPGILNRVLKLGETVIIPIDERNPPPPPAAEKIPAFDGNHVVKKGETLWSLGLRYKIDPQTLAQANGMELDQILPEGKTLKVPDNF